MINPLPTTAERAAPLSMNLPPDWAAVQAARQMLSPQGQHTDHWKVVVLLGTPAQVSVALGRVCTQLAQTPDGPDLDLQTVTYDASSRQAAERSPETRVTIWNGNPALKDRPGPGRQNRENQWALLQVGNRGHPRQRAICTGDATDFRDMTAERLAWLDGRVLILPLWCAQQGEAQQQIRNAMKTRSVLRSPL